MKFFLILLLAGCQIALGQVNSTGTAKKSSHSTMTSDTGRVVDIRERLVQLAMQNPNYEVADRSVTLAGYQIRIAKSQWLATISAQGNINEFTINPKSTGSTNGAANTIYYPKYNFGINIPFDIFTRIPNNVKMARQTYYIAEANKNEKYREIKEQVLTIYEDYLLAKATLEFQIQVTQDEYTLYKRAEKDYSDGIIKLEDFDKAYKGWTAEEITRLSALRNLNVIKLTLERVIGVRIDDLIKQTKP